MQIDPNKVVWDAPAATPAPAATSPTIDASKVVWDEPAAPAGGVAQTVGNIAAGAVRGAGSIGATLLAPVDMAKDALAGKGLSLESNRERRQGMDQALGTLGAQPDSTAFQIGKVGAEVAGTLGVGGALGLGAKAAGAAPLGEALASGGLRAGGAGLATRLTGGAVSGAGAAGLVDPEHMAAGAAIGAALPAVVGGMAKAGGIAEKAFRGPEVAEGVRKAAEAGQSAGYVIPPTQVQPSLRNRIVEGIAGKLTTAQNASARNQTVSNDLARKSLGLAPDTPLNIETLDAVRRSASAAYQPVAESGIVTPNLAYTSALNRALAPFKSQSQSFPGTKAPAVVADLEALRSPQFDAGDALNAIRSMREAADRSYRAGEKMAGGAYKTAAGALEDALETHLGGLGQPAAEILKGFRDARQLIAKTYSVESALNPVTGTVNAIKLGAMLAKGKPLSGELKQAAEFANAFPTAAKTPERMGSLPQTSPLDWAAAAGIGAATGGSPLAAAGLIARPLARSAALSEGVQRSLSQQAARPNPALGFSARDRLAGLDYLTPGLAVGLSGRDR